MKQILLLIFTLTLTVAAQAQQIMWEQGYDNSPVTDSFLAMSRINDTSVVVSGISMLSGLRITFFAEYRASGTRPWLKFGREVMTADQDIQPYDNGYYFTGWNPNRSVMPNGSHIMLQRLGPQGDTIWTKVYTGHNYDGAERLMLHNNSIYMLGIGVNNTGGGTYTLLKTDLNGNLQWRRFYQRGFNDFGTDIVARPNGNLVLSGTVQPGSNDDKMHLVEIAAQTGDSLRSATITIKGSGYRETHKWGENNFSFITDSSYIASGTIDSANYKLGYIAKIDTSFNVVWSRIMRPHPGRVRLHTNKVKELANGDFVVLSYDVTSAGVGNIFHITRYSATGQFISETPYTSQICTNIFFNDWELLADGSAMIAGFCFSNGEAYIARLGNVGIPAVIVLGTPKPEAKKELLGQSYPNPTAATAAIPYRLPKGTLKATIVLHDVVTGRKVKSFDLPASEMEGNLTVELSGLSNGLYTYSLIVDGKPIATKKLAVMK